MSLEFKVFVRRFGFAAATGTLAAVTLAAQPAGAR